MPIRCSTGWFAGLALLCGASFCSAGEPQAEFALKAGWVECTVEGEGKPLADALIRILDEKGSNFAEGETDERGQGQFPVPEGKWFTVEIKTGKRTADPIRLSKTGAGIEPARVLLSYGLRPCCRVLLRRDAVKSEAAVEKSSAASDAMPIWLLAGTTGGALLCAVAIVLVASRRSSIRPS
jgi:hypothetical protein